MEAKHGPACYRCPRYKEFFKALLECEGELVERAAEISDTDIEAEVTPASFICRATVETECEAAMTPAKLEFRLIDNQQ
jgi:hypothetical protein